MTGSVLDLLSEIIDRRGSDSYLGEDLSMREHMLQAAQLAEQAGASDEEITAALLHDIGHYADEFAEQAMQQGQDHRHEENGAKILAGHFPPAVISAVRNHVAAKRYLCAVDPEYAACLSDASVYTLKLQGGPMDDAEIAAFEREPHMELSLKVRRWDDQAKVAGKSTPDFAHYLPVLQRVAIG